LRADSEQIWGYPPGKDDFNNVTHLAQRDQTYNKHTTNKHQNNAAGDCAN